jgi:SAM-dependent methyltransferase
LDHPRLSLVSHEQIFLQAGALPCFNSDAIALQLHRVPGLSRRFIVINDDCFLGQPVAASDFLGADGTGVVYLDDLAPPRRPDDDPLSNALVRTRALIEQRLGEHAIVGMFAHTPQLYDRDLLEALEEMLGEEFRRTSASRFRSPSDLVLRLLYPCTAVAGLPGFRHAVPRVLKSGSPEYSFVQLTDSTARALRELGHVATSRPRFICINDDLGTGPTSRFVGRCLQRTLAQMFPVPSAFELGIGPGPVPRRTQAMGGADPHAASYWNARLSTNWSSAGVGSLAYGRQVNKWRNRVRVRVFRRALGDVELDPASARVLDVGAGTGLYLSEWQRLGVRSLVGLDIADAAVRRLRVAYPGVELHQADIGGESLPFAAGSFDLVSAFAVLFHIVDDGRYRAAIRNLSDVLAPRGYLLVTDSPLSVERREGRYWVARSEEAIRRALADVELEVVSIRPESVLLSPPQRLGEPWTTGWDRLMSYAAGREWAGWAAGAVAYPFELALTARLTRGPSTDLFVCRKGQGR